MSLWLMPEGEERRPFTALIEELATRHGTPRFEPHLTLLGGVRGARPELERRAAALAGRLRPFRIHLTTVGWSREFFRCLFVQAEPGPDLLAARAAAETAFDQRPEEPFLPHVGLMYCDLPPEAKEAIADEVGRRLPVEFTARAVHLYLTEGDPSQWRPVGRFPSGRAPDRR